MQLASFNSAGPRARAKPRNARLPVLWTLLVLFSTACRCEPELPKIPIRALGGSISQVEAAYPEGGASPTASASDLSVPPRDGDLGWWVQVACAPDGTVHLAYTDAYNGELHHAWRVAGQWKIEIVDHYGAVGKYPALAIDAQGRPHILYYNQDKERLLYATKVEGLAPSKGPDRRRPVNALPNWLYEVVDDGPEVGMAGHLLAAPDGSLDGLYYRTDETLVHVHRPPSTPGKHRSWRLRIVDHKAGGSHSIVTGFVRGPDNSLHASYAHWTVFDSSLRYARFEGDTESGHWTHESVPAGENAGWKSALVLDAEGAPIIAYLALRTRHIFVTRRDAKGQWQRTPLVGDANTLSMVREPDGNLALGYEYLPGVGLTGAKLRILTHPKDAPLFENWSLGTLDHRGAMASYLSAATHPTKGVVFAWYDGNIRGVKVWWPGEGW